MTLLDQAIELVKQAVAEDDAANYTKAFALYMSALDYFNTHLKYEKNPKVRDSIKAKLLEYVKRAEQIRELLDNDGVGAGGNGTDSVKPKGQRKGDRGGDDDAEQTKLRSGLNSAIVREKPNVKWSDVAGLEGAKQALQEAVILPVKFPQFFTGFKLLMFFFF